MAAISSAHAMIDACHGAMAALLPFLIAEHDWSYAMAAALITAGSLAAALIQPGLGYLSDRRAVAPLMPVAIVVGAAGVGGMAVAPSFGLALVSAAAGGIALGAFHPEASRYASYLSGTRRATGMSLFAVGGNAGLALGPVAVTPTVALLGLPGALLLVLPAAAVALWLTIELPWLAGFRPLAATPGRPETAAVADDWQAFARLTVVVAARAFTFFGFLTFVPLYLVEVLGTSVATGNAALTVFLVGGASGTLLGGRLADRVGRRPVLVGGLLLIVPLTLAVLVSPVAVAMPLLCLLGVATVGTFSVTVVMGQEYLPGRLGVASGVIFGVSGGLGAAGAPVLGLIGDAYGVDITLLAVGMLALVGVTVALTLPRAQ